MKLRIILAVVLITLCTSLFIFADASKAKCPMMGKDAKQCKGDDCMISRYVCPTDHYYSDKAGKCPTCKKELVALKVMANYCCQKCEYMSETPGKCPKCGKEMMSAKECCMKGKEGEKATVASGTKYVCSMCKYESDKPGKCPKCGMELKKMAAVTTPQQAK